MRGKILAIAVRTARLGPMKEVSEAKAVVDEGILGDRKVHPDRGVTLLSLESWEAVQKDLGVELPWYTRRANVLVEGLDLGQTIGGTLALGAVRLEIKGETDPCQAMELFRAGLQAALVPDRRGGVHGRVAQGGFFRPGDPVVLLESGRGET